MVNPVTFGATPTLPSLNNNPPGDQVSQRPVVDLRKLPGVPNTTPPGQTKLRPGEVVLNKFQFQDLNKNLDLSGVKREQPRSPAFQFAGSPYVTGGAGRTAATTKQKLQRLSDTNTLPKNLFLLEAAQRFQTEARFPPSQ